MNIRQQLTVEDASRLAVTATVADLEDWSRAVAVRGQIELQDLLGVLEIMRSDSLPQQQLEPTFDTLSVG
jgi:hypothetical protein